MVSAVEARKQLLWQRKIAEQLKVGAQNVGLVLEADPESGRTGDADTNAIIVPGRWAEMDAAGLIYRHPDLDELLHLVRAISPVFPDISKSAAWQLRSEILHWPIILENQSNAIELLFGIPGWIEPYWQELELLRSDRSWSIKLNRYELAQVLWHELSVMPYWPAAETINKYN